MLRAKDWALLELLSATRSFQFPKLADSCSVSCNMLCMEGKVRLSRYVLTDSASSSLMLSGGNCKIILHWRTHFA